MTPYQPRPETVAACRDLSRSQLIELADRLLREAFVPEQRVHALIGEVRRNALLVRAAAAWSEYERQMAALAADYPDGCPVHTENIKGYLNYLHRLQAAMDKADESADLSKQYLAAFNWPAGCKA